jgi:hypothetical protein
MPLERRAGSAPSAGGGQDFGGVRRGGGVMRVARGRDPGVRVRSGRGVERVRVSVVRCGAAHLSVRDGRTAAGAGVRVIS